MRHSTIYRVIITILIFSPLLSSSQSLTDSLKAHFKFDGDVLDTSGNNENLINPLVPEYKVIFGSDSAYYFDGSTRLISQNQFDNSTYSETAISMWVKTDVPTNNSKQVIIQGAFMRFGVYITSNNTIAAFFDTPSANALSDTTDISNGKWHHVVAQNNGDSTFIFIDGQFKGKKYQPLKVGNGASNNKLYLGNTNLNTYPYSGSINDLRIYNRILTQSEIDTLSTFSCNLTSTISSLTDVSCLGGSNGSITVSVDSGTANYNYKWSSSLTTSNVSDTFNTINGLAPGKYFVTITDTNCCSVMDSATITVLDTIIATRDTSIVSACDNYTWTRNNQSYSISSIYKDTSFSALGCDSVYHVLDLTINSTSRSIDTIIACDSLVWRDGITYFTNNNSATDTLINSLGCDSIIALNLIIKNIDLTVYRSGDSLYSLQAGNTYQWIDCGNGDTLISGATSKGFKPGVAGDFAVIINNGVCFDTSACIEFNPCILTASFIDQTDVTCFNGNDGSITVSVDSGLANYNYVWSDNSSTLNISDTFNTISGLTAGKYFVSITDTNNCKVIDSISISEPTALSVSINVDSLPSGFGLSDGGLTAIASGGTPAYTYAWSIATTTSSLSGLTSGTYTVTVSDSNNCLTIVSSFLTEPDILTCSTDVVNTSCSAGSDGSVTIVPAGGVAPYSYLWNNSDTTATIDSLTAGTYTVTLTDNNGITTTCNGAVTSPSAIYANLASIDVSCKGLSDGSISISISGGTSPYSYLWNTLANASSISSLTAASYTVTISDANGCMLIDSATVNLVDSTIAIYDTLNTSECDNYTWSQNNQVYSSSGFFRDTSFNSSGCDSVYHVLDLTVLNLDLTVVNAGDSLYALQAGNTYQWIDCGNGDTLIPGAIGKGFKPGISGNFAVIIDNGVCSDTSGCNLIQLVGVEKITGSSEFSVYPNPTNENITMVSQNLVGETAQITNITGALLIEFTITSNKELIDLASLENGVYFLKVGTKINKIILTR